MSTATFHSGESEIERRLRAMLEDPMENPPAPRSTSEQMDSPDSTPTVSSRHDQPFSAMSGSISGHSSSPQPMQHSDTHGDLHTAHVVWPVSGPGPVGAVMTGPAPTPSITGSNGPPTCTNCATSTTPLWRRDAIGAVLCNACGLFLKLHKRARPISLKTDVIKSRNRIKTARPFPPNSKKKSQAQHPPGFNVTTDPNGLPITHHASQKSLHDHDGAASPVPHYPHNLTHFGDIDGHFPVFSIPGASSAGATSPHHGEHRGDVHETQDNSTLKTRISELELINELFRGQLTRLEDDQAQLRQQLDLSRDTENQLRLQLIESHQREMAFKRRLDQVLGPQASPDRENSLKRPFDEAMGSQDASLDLVNDDINGHSDHLNGHANGHIDGHASDNINGNGSDHINGHGSDHAEEHADEATRPDHSLAKRFKADPGHDGLPAEHDAVVDPSMQATMDETHAPNSPMDQTPVDHASTDDSPSKSGPEVSSA